MSDDQSTPAVAAPVAADAPVDANSVKEAVVEARKHKLKVDGQEVEVDEDELKRGYSHQRAANKILQEGKAAKKQAEEFISQMRDKGKLFEVIKKLGHDPRQLSEEFLASMLEDETMDPRDKELRDARGKLKAIEDMEKQQREAVQKQRELEVRQQYMQEYESTFIKALETAQLPPTKPMVAEMAKYIARSAKIGFKMTADEAAKLVREDIQMAHQRLIGDSDGEILIKLLGEQVANKIRKYDTSKLKNPEQNLQTPKDQAPMEDRVKRPKQRLTAAEWREHRLGKK